MNNCIGCGIFKQIEDQNNPGYAAKIDNPYCLRCFKIKNYNELIAQEIKASDFIEKLKEVIKSEKQTTEFYYILDIYDLNASRIIELEELLSKFKVIIIINKIDLLPKSVKLSKIAKYITELFAKTSLKKCDIILMTTTKKNFVNSLLNKVKKTQTVKYFIGSSNVGKSSIINAIMTANNLIPQVLVSNYFNTTLEFIDIKLDSQTKLIDTPGISRQNSIANLTTNKQQKHMYFTKELKQITYQLNSNNSIFYEALCWFDFLSEKEIENSFHVYTNKDIKTHRTSFKNSLNYYEKNKFLLDLNIKNKNISKYEFLFDKKTFNKEYDIVISGLGWISFKVTKEFKIVVNIPTDNNKVDVILRRSII
ncbi:GTP-binding protein YqeH [Entomoplasma ellychniae]|uniref:GTP-binding protein YqeH n=1 Tax=Entomoplasma ellychniae TaxID=2114 RepID=A0A8E2U9V8_9MOLU|nr:ribosome biogenesis GTPase YqeH [Entomoplasma ellychniae]PPE04544.1 GTP-binding protein YqeH [Entomoplasma ellychniae]